MAELTFRSPGVGTREIDLSGPTAIKPQGTPAGIIGTALQGPAFVPQTVATWQEETPFRRSTSGISRVNPLVRSKMLSSMTRHLSAFSVPILSILSKTSRVSASC